jgi:hypothetical protein
MTSTLKNSGVDSGELTGYLTDRFNIASTHQQTRCVTRSERPIFEYENSAYVLATPGRLSCVISWSPSQHFPRNSICLAGEVFQIVMLSSVRPLKEIVPVKLFVIPASVEMLGTEWLSGTSIELSAFESHSKLITLSQSAFANFSPMKSFCIPASLKDLGVRPFCFTRFSHLTFEPDIELIQMSQNPFSNCSSLRAIHIPKSVEIIGECSFLRCSVLRTISFESGSKLNRIAGQPFSSCLALTSICIPSSVEIICNSSFAFCSSLSTLSFDFGSQLNKIGMTQMLKDQENYDQRLVEVKR